MILYGIICYKLFSPIKQIKIYCGFRLITLFIVIISLYKISVKGNEFEFQSELLSKMLN